MAIPVVKSEVVQGSWPQHLSQNTAAKHLCQILGAFETHTGKSSLQTLLALGLVWMTGVQICGSG